MICFFGSFCKFRDIFYGLMSVFFYLKKEEPTSKQSIQVILWFWRAGAESFFPVVQSNMISSITQKVEQVRTKKLHECICARIKSVSHVG
jgi:hypothetical protein